MPHADLSHTRLYYVLDGAPDAPVLMLSNSLGTSTEMWAPQVPAFARHFRVLRYDTRGHGRSSTPPGEYGFAELGADAMELLDHLGIAQACFCGLSMGGPTGLWFTLEHPTRVRKLVLCNTAARLSGAGGMDSRIAAVRAQGLDALAPALMERWLSARFRETDPVSTQLLQDMLRGMPADGYAANCAAVRDGDFRTRVAQVAVPTLVLGGRYDSAVTPEDSRALAAAIPGARYEELDAAHISNWEQRDRFTHLVLEFLRS